MVAARHGVREAPVQRKQSSLACKIFVGSPLPFAWKYYAYELIGVSRNRLLDNHRVGKQPESPMSFTKIRWQQAALVVGLVLTPLLIALCGVLWVVDWKTTRLSESIEDLRVASIGQNLLEEEHLEFTPASPAPRQIERGFYARFSWRP
jgi:hypothetical protein